MRRRGVGLALALVAVVLLSACQDWTQFMGGATHDGNDAGETIVGTGNLAKLHEVFSIPGAGTSPTAPGVTTANGYVYAVGGSGLEVASIDGDGCGGTPKVCQPLWTAAHANFGFAGGISQPVVANGVVYQSTDGTSAGDLRAFDADGVTNCSGSPKVCQPLWTAPASSDAGPAFDAGKLFLNTRGGILQAYDANGVTNCSGNPVVCQPLWTASVPARWIPTVADGKVYVATQTAPDELEAFDENGVTNCAGSPVVCQPLFTASLPGTVNGSIAVSDGVAYALTSAGLAAVDANGTDNCSGTPVVCQPLWTAPSVATTTNEGDTPAVANGTVYVLNGSGIPSLFAFDAAGTVDCSGNPKVCTALGSSPGAVTSGIAPMISNGVLWLGGQAWDATALASTCGPPPSSLCAPLRTITTVDDGPTTVSLGTVFIPTGSEIDAYQT